MQIKKLIDRVNKHVTREEFDAISESGHQLKTHKNTLLTGFMAEKFNMNIIDISKELGLHTDTTYRLMPRYRELLSTDMGSAYVMNIWRLVSEDTEYEDR